MTVIPQHLVPIWSKLNLPNPSHTHTHTFWSSSLTLSEPVSQSREARDSRDPRKLFVPSRVVSHLESRGLLSAIDPPPPGPLASLLLSPLVFRSWFNRSWYLGFWVTMVALGVDSSSSDGLSDCLLESTSDSWRTEAEDSEERWRCSWGVNQMI